MTDLNLEKNIYENISAVAEGLQRLTTHSDLYLLLLKRAVLDGWLHHEEFASAARRWLKDSED